MDQSYKKILGLKPLLNLNSTPNYSYGSREKVENIDESFNSTNSNEGELISNNDEAAKKESKSMNDERIGDLEFTSDQALNDLEERIKQWHLQNGCKNPLLETFHRIDAEVSIYAMTTKTSA